jgi:hypothetical protein
MMQGQKNIKTFSNKDLVKQQGMSEAIHYVQVFPRRSLFLGTKLIKQYINITFPLKQLSEETNINWFIRRLMFTYYRGELREINTRKRCLASVH